MEKDIGPFLVVQAGKASEEVAVEQRNIKRKSILSRGISSANALRQEYT